MKKLLKAIEITAYISACIWAILLFWFVVECIMFIVYGDPVNEDVLICALVSLAVASTTTITTINHKAKALKRRRRKLIYGDNHPLDKIK